MRSPRSLGTRRVVSRRLRRATPTPWLPWLPWLFCSLGSFASFASFASFTPFTPFSPLAPGFGRPPDPETARLPAAPGRPQPRKGKSRDPSQRPGGSPLLSPAGRSLSTKTLGATLTSPPRAAAGVSCRRPRAPALCGRRRCFSRFRRRENGPPPGFATPQADRKRARARAGAPASLVPTRAPRAGRRAAATLPRAGTSPDLRAMRARRTVRARCTLGPSLGSARRHPPRRARRPEPSIGPPTEPPRPRSPFPRWQPAAPGVNRAPAETAPFQERPKPPRTRNTAS